MIRVKMYIWSLIFICISTWTSCTNKNECFVSYSSVVNGSYEQLTDKGDADQWSIFQSQDYVELVQDEKSAQDGSKYLRFSFDGNTDSPVDCINLIITDLVQEEIKIEFYYHPVDTEDMEYGFTFNKKVKGKSMGQQVRIDLDDKSSNTKWQKFSYSIPKEELNDQLMFGFWASGKGEIWLDSWNLLIDGYDYDLAASRVVSELSPVEYQKLSSIAKNMDVTSKISKNNDLSWMKDELGEADIVLLGESTHGTKEFIDIRTSLTEYLITEMGFSVVALEADMAAVSDLYDRLNIETSDDELKSEIANLKFWNYRNQSYFHFFKEVENMIDEGQKIILTGIDVQDYESANQKIIAFSKKYKINSLKKAVYDIMLDPSKCAQSINCHNRVSNIIGDLDQGAMSEYSSAEYDYILKVADVVSDGLVLRYNSPSRHFRDQQMAENVLKYYNRGQRKIIVWAHNEHIKYTDKAMGYWLDAESNLTVHNIAFTTGHGKYASWNPKTSYIQQDALVKPVKHSWESVFDRVGISNFYIPIKGEHIFSKHANRRYRKIGSMHTPKQFLATNLSANYDGIIYVDTTSSVVSY